MNNKEIEKTIEEAWNKKDQINKNSDQKIIDVINQTINDLDSGKVRVAEKINGSWVTHQYLKKAIMLSFRIYEMESLSGPYSSWYDKSHLLKGKTAGWTKDDHAKAGFRMVPNSPVRKGSFIGKNVVLMPCFINIGTYIDEGTMMDTFSRAGSCCQIGKNCHISAGSGVGGVLEPAQALPTIIEDNVFLGAMSEIVEGVIVQEIDPDGLAARAGVLKNDIIYSLGRSRFKNTNEFNKALDDLNKERNTTIGVARQGSKRILSLKLTK